MIRHIIILFASILLYVQSYGQLGFSFKDAGKHGISIGQLDSTYQSAIHTDISQAVFKTDEEQNSMAEAYGKLLNDLGQFLSKNKFRWQKPTRCFNRIYFNADGGVDYFLFNFIGKDEDKPSMEIQLEFERLLNLFIKDHKIAMTATKPFAQCSPVTYNP